MQKSYNEAIAKLEDEQFLAASRKVLQQNIKDSSAESFEKLSLSEIEHEMQQQYDKLGNDQELNIGLTGFIQEMASRKKQAIDAG